MRRIIVVGFSVFALVSLMAAPGQAAGPTFFFDRNFGAVSFWDQSSATEQVTTSVGFYTSERAYPDAGPRETLTLLSYARAVSTWNGTTWELTSATYATAHTSLGDMIDFTIGPGARSITASATAHLRECIPSWPNCTEPIDVQLAANWAATGHPDAGGFHIPDWWGGVCEVDFASGSVISIPASGTATLDGASITGDPGYSGIQKIQDVEVNFCPPGP